MNQAMEKLAEKIIMEIALMTIQGEGGIRQKMIEKYGEFGFETAEEFINNWKKVAYQEDPPKIKR